MTEITIKLLEQGHSEHVRFLDAVDQISKHFALNEMMDDGHVGVCYDALASMFGPRMRRETYTL